MQLKLDIPECYRQGSFVLGVSGGIDSMVLLDAMLRRLRDPNRLQIVHVNYGLRAEAHDDAEFVRATANHLDVPCEVIAAPSCPRGDNVQAWARELRYAAMERVASTMPGSAIMTAHHADDQAETVFWHWLRGAGLNGVTGMALHDAERLTVPQLRPLLTTTRSVIEAYARERRVAFREDASNQDASYSRNVIRHDILPRCQALNAQASAHVVAWAERARIDEAYLMDTAQRALADLHYERNAHGLCWSRAALLVLHPAVQVRVLQLLFRKLAGDEHSLSSVHLAAMQRLCRGEGLAFCLPGPHVVERSGDMVQLRAGALQDVADNASETSLVCGGV